MVLATCPSPAQISASLRGITADDDVDSLLSHCDQCPSCAALADSLERTPDPIIDRLRGSAPRVSVPRQGELNDLMSRVKDLGAREELVSEESCEATAANASFPHRLREYKLLEQIGSGAMGAVYRGVHVRLDRPVAVKLLARHRLGEGRFVDRFEREMRALGRLHHPNVVSALDAGEEQGTYFLVMELVPGLDASELVRRVGPLPVSEACEVVRQAALALEHVRQLGLVHRDVKPSNLLVGTDGTVKVSDLGLALLLDQPLGDELSCPGQAMGTAEYMAPEQFGDSHTVDSRADVYGLGCTLYKLLTGEPPFSHHRFGSSLGVLAAHRDEPVPRITTRRDDVPQALSQILDRMLAKSPDERFEKPGLLADALEPWTEQADLRSLVSRATSDSPTDHVPHGTDGPHAQPTAPPQAKQVGPRRSRQRIALLGIFRSVAVLLALSLIGVGVIAGITIKIRNKAGQVVGQATVPDGSDITADEQGGVRVRMPNGKVLELTDNDTTKKSEQVLPDAAPASADVSPSVPATPLPFDAQSADKYREEFAESQGLPTFKDNSIEMNLALVPPGEFDMGSSEQELPYFMKFTEKEIADRINPDPNWVAWVRGRVLAETPRHRVQITQPFYMGTCEVTVGQFKRFAEESGFRRQAEEDGSEGWGRHHPEDDWPMMMVTWDEARAFCKWLSDEEDATYRLPTEAEWEYAARAGGTSSWFFDGDESGLEKVAWYKLNAAAPNPVGQKQPNSFGLYDVYGNVWEWCEDGYVEQYYRTAPPRDPKGPSGNIGQRVTRGGGFLFDFHECRSANKRPQFPEMARSYLGFRVVCEVHDQSQ